MRVFFGVSLTKDSQKAVDSVIKGLKEQYNGNFTLDTNTHITLAFIGEVDAKVLDMLAQIGNSVFLNVPNISVLTSGIESFKDGRITYLKVCDNQVLSMLYDRLTDALDIAGIDFDHKDKYRPHITLRRGAKVDVSYHVDDMALEAEAICLYESKRVDDVLRYIPLYTWRMGERC